ncbi:hypothetical protein [Peterkaempfera sp. SMS 1(5)a]|uniref:hypothetical protein n=1 Tax=Peterkaempfera podocarpi TaxID=3232308 RepID=UPI00366E3B31
MEQPQAPGDRLREAAGGELAQNLCRVCPGGAVGRDEPFSDGPVGGAPRQPVDREDQPQHSGDIPEAGVVPVRASVAGKSPATIRVQRIQEFQQVT